MFLSLYLERVSLEIARSLPLALFLSVSPPLALPCAGREIVFLSSAEKECVRAMVKDPWSVECSELAFLEGLVRLWAVIL